MKSENYLCRTPKVIKISTGKQQGLLGQEFATMIKINVKEKLLVKAKGGVLNELWKNE